MNKFWKFLEDKDYARLIILNNNYEQWGLCDTGGEPFYHTKQMLIGYMIEYLLNKTDDDLNDMIACRAIVDIETLYGHLKSLIESPEVSND